MPRFFAPYAIIEAAGTERELLLQDQGDEMSSTVRITQKAFKHAPGQHTAHL